MADAARQLHSVVTIDDLAAAPERVDELGDIEVSTMMVRCFGVLGALQGRVIRRSLIDAAETRARERMLTSADVADRLGMSLSWVEKNTDRLPARRNVAGTARWREADINEYIRDREAFTR